MSAGRRSPFGMLVRTEARLLLREPIALLWGVAFPMALLAVMGLSSRGPNRSLGGIRLVDAYEPILIAFSCATFACRGCPRCSPGTGSAACCGG